MYFRQFWQDPRLSFDRRPGLDKLVVGAEYIKLIWVPDTFFVNEKTAYFHDATTDNQFVRIFHTGDILRSIRYGIQVSKSPSEIYKYAVGCTGAGAGELHFNHFYPEHCLKLIDNRYRANLSCLTQQQRSEGGSGPVTNPLSNYFRISPWTCISASFGRMTG